MPLFWFLYDVNRTESENIELLATRIKQVIPNLDSKNVKRLDTNETVIKSADGSTEIKGPKLIMKDESDVVRVELGLDIELGKFLFNLYNAAGILTVGTDDDGNATYTGIITGGVIRTAAEGKRIELSGNSYKTYNEDGNLEGLVQGDETGGNYGDIYLYNDGDPAAKFYNTVADGFALVPIGTYGFILGAVGKTILARGSWNCSNASFSDLKDGSDYYAKQSYVDGLISSLQSQINALDSRITALETP